MPTTRRGRGLFRSQSERVTAGSDSTTSNSSGGNNNVVLVDMRPAEDAEFGLDEIMVRALEERPHPPAPKPEKANTTSRVVRRAKSAVAMRGKNNGNGGSRIVPRFRIFGSSAGGGGNGVADIGGGGRSNVTAEVRPRSAAIARSTSSVDVMRLGEAPDMSLPVLLSVRKVPGGATPSQQEAAVSAVPPGPPSLPTAAASAPSSSKKRSFFRIFHRSATLLFQHPTTELNPNKPYKGSISLSTKDLRNNTGARYTRAPSGGPDSLPASASSSSAPHQRPVPGPQTMGSGGGYAKRQQMPAAGHRSAGHSAGHRSGNSASAGHRMMMMVGGRGHRRGPHSMPYNPPLPSPPAAVIGGSSSSLNSSVLHHNLENDANKDSDSENGGQGSSSSGVESDSKLLQMRMMQHPILQQAHSSSSNSVISSVDSSNYDSGAYSRTSSPEMGKKASAKHRHRRIRMQQQRLKEQTAALLKASGSMSKSACSLQQGQQPPPLSAPTLVLAACRGSRGVLTMPDYGDLCRNFETLELAANSNGGGGDPVDAAHILACLNAMQTRQQQQQFHHGGLQNDVSITIGASTKLTIASDTTRRGRQLPMMGTSGLMTSPGKQQEPVKNRSRAGLQQQQHRTKISTVYLPPNPPSPAATARCCDSRVTVNGRHHCNCGKNAVSDTKRKGKNSVVNV